MAERISGRAGAIVGALVLAGGEPRPADGQAARLYAFNVGSKDVTVIDPGTHTVIETRPLGASVRWLSNEQDFFDGRYLWTYEADAQASVLVIDPQSWTVVRRIPVGRGPAHSVILTPDRRLALVDVSGDDRIAVIDTATYQVVRTIPMGKFPCDLDLSPDGGWAYVPERDQDSVAILDLSTWQVVRRAGFPAGSKPHMLRVAPDGRTVWVQTAAGGTNDVLEAATLRTLKTHRVGRVPVTNAFSPDGRYTYVSHFEDDFVSVFDTVTLVEVGRVRVGQQIGNLTFRPDGKFAYATVIGANTVAVIDTASLQVVKQIPVGREPWGLIVWPTR